MGFSADILASTLQDLLPEYEDLYTEFHPLWARVKSGGGFNRRKLKGPWVDFNVLTGGPGQALTDQGGTALSSTRENNLKTGTEYGARIVYHFAVPNKDLDEASTPYDFANLIESYGDASLADAMERMAFQLGSGKSSAGTDPFGGGVDGFITLNSDQTYLPQANQGARTGVFEYTATQVDTVHSLPKENAATNPTTGWKHQYGDISSFNIDGRRALRTARDKANMQGATLSGGIDLLIGDETSYQNYADNLDDQIIAAVVENDKGQGKVREGLKFGTAIFFPDPHIDVTDTTAFSTAAAQSGVIYGMCTEDWEFFTVGSKNGGKELFRVHDPMPVYDQTSTHYRISFYANLFCRQLRRQFCVTGGANP